jgi:Tfp pilus assembly protein PilF
MTTFQEYTETFPATLNEYLVGRAIEDSSTPILGSMYAMPIEDLKAIYLNNSGQDLIFRASRFASTRTTSLLWIEVALVYLNEGLLQDADAALNQAFLTTEVFSAIFAAFGLIEEAKMSLSSAQKFYRKGLSIDFEDEACLLGLARVLMAQNASSGAVFEAETLIRRLLKIDPAIPEAWSILARCCHETGRIVEASSHFERALKKETMAPLRSIRSLNKSF